jgi:hypothetical protein
MAQGCFGDGSRLVQIDLPHEFSPPASTSPFARFVAAMPLFSCGKPGNAILDLRRKKASCPRHQQQPGKMLHNANVRYTPHAQSQNEPAFSPGGARCCSPFFGSNQYFSGMAFVGLKSVLPPAESQNRGGSGSGVLMKERIHGDSDQATRCSICGSAPRA